MAVVKRITVAFVMGHDPCWADARERLPRLLGKRGMPLRACLDVPGVYDKDKVWLATRKGACSERVQRMFAAACAERVLPRFEERYPDDERPRVAIQTAVAFALGMATAEELAVARAASDAAASYADAAAAAASYASYADAAAAASYADPAAASRKWQVGVLRGLLEAEEDGQW